jgi:hypothetical protein
MRGTHADALVSRLPLTDELIAGVGANLCWTLAVSVPILLPNLDVPMLTAGRYLLLGCISALLLLWGGFPRLHARDRAATSSWHTCSPPPHPAPSRSPASS